jgi:hypothetical protein
VAGLVAAVDWRRIRFAEQLLMRAGCRGGGGRAKRASALLGRDRAADDGAAFGQGLSDAEIAIWRR